LDGAPSALLKLIPIAVVSCSHASATVSCRAFQSGTTCAPSTVNRGVVTSTSLVVDSPAKRSPVQQEVATTPSICGPRCYGSAPKCHPRGCLQKTLQRKPSQRLPKISQASDTKLDTNVLRPPHWLARIRGRDGLWLPTPMASYNVDAPSMMKWPAYRMQARWTGGKTMPKHQEFLMGWPIGWTDFKPLEMDRFRQWSELHGLS